MEQPIRALTLLDVVPAGCFLYPVTNDDSAPHLHVGEFAIVDTTDTQPQHGELYLVRRSDGGTSLQQLLARSHTCDGQTYVGFWTRCLNFKPYRENRTQGGQIRQISHRSMADGPRLADVIQKSLVGRIVGVCGA
jgi:hypothetical protein